ncbi:MAG: M23 family metallopeptidase [Clostridia bacterium]|nr:M23 family metallopeptidase [Clostridia bacterium]
MDKNKTEEEKLRSNENGVSLLEKEEDVNAKYAELLEKIDIDNDYDDILSKYEKTIEQRTKSTIKRISGDELEPIEEKTEQPVTEDEKIEEEKLEEEESREPETQEEDGVSFVQTVYDLIEEFGLSVGNGVKRALRRPKKLIGWIVSFFKYVLRFVWLSVVNLIDLVTHKFVEQVKDFRKDVKKASNYLKRSNKSPTTSIAVFMHYIKKGVIRHKALIKTVLNVAMPVLATIAFIITVNYWSNVTFALRVSYDDKEIGYIADETVYNEAQTAAKARFDTGKDAGTADFKEPTYELALVSLNQLVDSTVLCDRIIENSGDNVTNACGIYIDNDFICAIKNETDATSVFNAILEPFEEQVKDENSFVDFVEKVEYVQGLYPEDKDTMWDASRLAEQLSQTKQAAVKYTVKDGDTIYGIAVAHGLTERELIALNPSMGDNIYSGDTVIISNEVNYVRVKVMKTETRTQEVDYETEFVNNASMFKGTKRTVRNGEPGEDKVTELVTYVDGQRVSAEEVSRERIKEPVNAKVQVGTKSASAYGYNYNVSVSGSGFVWPAPACSYISSYYGWRTLRGYSDFHTGIDLTRPGGGSTGAIIVASLDGTVESVQRSYSGYGHSIVINHGGGLKTRYAHCLQDSISVYVGQRVSAGQAIARVGSTGNVTGPHLHFEIIINGNRVNPLPYIR